MNERKCFVVVREQWCGQGPTEDWKLIAVYSSEAAAEARAKAEHAKDKPPLLVSYEFVVKEVPIEDDRADVVAEIDRRLTLHDARLKVMSAEGAGGYQLALEELRRALLGRSV